ncbi:hypothetical protein CTA2_9438 [Colletotrichum tanaceti]|uniref:Uncharacterized protein n=1 Tax=Colletotrichum tanaceti TaxID=1306861 RepID=A0A4U6X145_9PEZI|nr:hypothetical protein CTA2_9438 [Colletotrichum tanaceti]TKW48613.1 hypothetical protein CTA1_10933 [Colletotrichum tanaceti]
MIVIEPSSSPGCRPNSPSKGRLVSRLPHSVLGTPPVPFGTVSCCLLSPIGRHAAVFSGQVGMKDFCHLMLFPSLFGYLLRKRVWRPRLGSEQRATKRIVTDVLLPTRTGPPAPRDGQATARLRKRHARSVRILENPSHMSPFDYVQYATSASLGAAVQVQALGDRSFECPN